MFDLIGTIKKKTGLDDLFGDGMSVPKSVQDVIKIDAVYSDGIFMTGKDRYSKTFKFTDINYAVSSKEDKEANFLRYSEILNSLENGISSQITIINRKLKKAELKEIALLEKANDDKDKYRKEINDKIYIYNNGKLPETWTLEKLFSKHPSQLYNPLIANAFFVAGYIESWGRGIDKICTACEKAGLQKPTYEIDATGIMLQIKANIDWDGNEIQYDENGNILTVQKKQTEKPEFTENFPEKQKQLIVIVTKDPTITTTEISNLMGCSRTTVSNIISDLKKLGVMERVGSDKKGVWKINDLS